MKIRKPDPLFDQITEFKPSKADLRRMSIVEAVIDCLAEDGLDKLTSLNISTRTKMLRSHVNYYFPNQDKMVAAAIQFVVTTGQEITVAHLAQATANPKEMLSAHTRATFAWFERYPKHARVMLLLHYYGAISPPYRKISHQILETGVSRIEAILAAGSVKKGTSKKTLNEVAKKIRAYLIGALTHALLCEPPLKFDEEFRIAEKTVQGMAKEVWS